VILDVHIPDIQRRGGRGRVVDRRSGERRSSRGGDDREGGRKIGAEQAGAILMERSGLCSGPGVLKIR
jgi:hypothetical protein